MVISSSLLGPILGGLLGFLGAIGATIITLIIARRGRRRVRRMDRERIDGHGQELDYITNVNGFPHRGTIDAAGNMHHSHHRRVEFQGCIEVNVARAKICVLP
ncbi:hypothetical protein GGR51DRAFT_508396 [Nemania sp. FL0031]|nr:hypothetical protein GGR51DRAFT_508396 [Nemania sp. FL0031]